MGVFGILIGHLHRRVKEHGGEEVLPRPTAPVACPGLAPAPTAAAVRTESVYQLVRGAL